MMQNGHAPIDPPGDESVPASPSASLEASTDLFDLRMLQYECWGAGERLLVEEMLAREPAFAVDDESVLELVYSEFHLRGQLGEQPDPQEYHRRFPQHRERLDRLFELHAMCDDPWKLSPSIDRDLALWMPSPVLVDSRDLAAGSFVPLSETPLVLGREPQAGLRLDDASVSRAHCRVWRDGAVALLEDAGSTNGTFVNGERVRRCLLVPGDRIRVGKFELILALRDDE